MIQRTIKPFLSGLVTLFVDHEVYSAAGFEQPIRVLSEV